ncbi:MAG: hypothetical protein JW841_07950 [Deltaproteobacteria bacterium]|nr:hypothetical protein [Deltaproteobacteria bacterium]
MLFKCIPTWILIIGFFGYFTYTGCAGNVNTSINHEINDNKKIDITAASSTSNKAAESKSNSPTNNQLTTPAHSAPEATSINNDDIAKAHVLYEQGNNLYREGKYEQAEAILNQAITLNPFMADANVLLAKILLMRTSASRDASLYMQARLMLEMAKSLKPNDTEIDVLLELVRRPTAE